MGKQNTNLRDRLSGGSFDRTKSFDARLKLQAKNSGIGLAKKPVSSSSSSARLAASMYVKDARQLLTSKSNRTSNSGRLTSSTATSSSSTTRNGRSSTSTGGGGGGGPIMIVTGLANIRKDGNKLRVIQRPPPIDKSVISDGRNTLVTLRNNEAALGKMKFYEEEEDRNNSSNGRGGDRNRDRERDRDRDRRGDSGYSRRDNHDDEFKAIRVQIDNDRPIRKQASPSPSHFRYIEESRII